MGVGDQRKEGQPSSSSVKKQKTLIPQGFQGQDLGHQGQGQIKAPNQLGPMTCFHCHHLRHMRRDFTKRQGSQSYRTPQS